MRHPVRLSCAALALFLLSACGQSEEPAPSEAPLTEVVEVDSIDNVSAAPPPEVTVEPDPAPVAAAPVPATDISDENVDAEITPMLAACLETGDAARGVSAAMGGCFREELRRQDERLNAAYRAAMGKRDAAGKAQLREEERAWIARRDATCEAERMGGTIDIVNVPHCLVDETIRRRIVLQGMAG